MTNGNREMQVEFHDKANELFFSLYRAFESASLNLNRRTEEYKFQQLKKQFAETMDKELQTVANDILVSHKHELQSREMNQMFHQFIKDYLNRFVQKVNSF
jgi:hypothetical protein